MSGAQAGEEHRLFAQPISVHGLPENEFRRRFQRVMLTKALLTTAFLSGLWIVACFTRDASDGWWWIWPSVACVLVATAQGWGLWRAHRHGKRLAASVTVELWPDSVIYRVPGRPPLVVNREDIVSLKLKAGPHGCLYVGNRHAAKSLAISNGLTDFDKLHAALRQWCPTGGGRNVFVWYLWMLRGLSVLNAACLVFIILSENPMAFTLAATVSLGICAWVSVTLYRSKYLDKVTRRKAWGWNVAFVGLVLAFTALKWLQWLGVL